MSQSELRQIASLELRPIAPEDHDVLAEIYASTRRDELAPIIDWTPDQKEGFLRHQFELQHRFYQEHFKQTAFDLLLRDGRVLGRLYVDRRGDEIRIVDIALLPEFRGQGLGARILRELLDEAAQRRVPVRIHVERENPAIRLYQRLGFREVEDQGVYRLLEWASERVQV